jgi:hypothetical protein
VFVGDYGEFPLSVSGQNIKGKLKSDDSVCNSVAARKFDVFIVIFLDINFRREGTTAFH